MTFLIDNQLPPRLAQYLTLAGYQSIHVSTVGIDSSDDRTVREYARANQFVVISKDLDFVNLTNQDPIGPPLVWVRLGNCRTPELFAAFDRSLIALVNSISAGQRIFELR